MAKVKITPRDRDYAGWYQDVVQHGDLAEPAEVVKGCMVIKPHGYAIWEGIQAGLDRRFKATGHKNAYFPIFIPQSFLRREAEHVEGFSPELAVVTIAGGKQLDEPYVVRPTSETIIGHFFAKWIQSWRDLPLLINQWANVVRWELRTRMFLRTSEFLWQEGHTAHATHEDAQQEALRMLDVYAEFAETEMAMPVIRGVKTQGEKFAGALTTYCIEAMMQSGLALQAGTSHDLGQNFGRAFDVKFQNQSKELEYVWQTSWGVTTRLVGALIMTHSDDRGLVLPPRLAPIQVAIVPILGGSDDAAVVAAANSVAAECRQNGITTEVDLRDQKPGFKFFHWEHRGVPIQLEIGPRDLTQAQVVVKQRHDGQKQAVPAAGIGKRLEQLLRQIQDHLLSAAQQRLAQKTVLADSVDEVAAHLAEATAEKGGGKFVMVHLADDPAAEAAMKKLKASIRCIPMRDDYDGEGRCVVTGARTKQRALVAKGY